MEILSCMISKTIKKFRRLHRTDRKVKGSFCGIGNIRSLIHLQIRIHEISEVTCFKIAFLYVKL